MKGWFPARHIHNSAFPSPEQHILLCFLPSASLRHTELFCNSLQLDIFERSHRQQAVVWNWQVLHRISGGISGWAEEVFVRVCLQVYVEFVCHCLSVLVFLLSQTLQLKKKEKKCKFFFKKSSAKQEISNPWIIYYLDSMYFPCQGLC